MYKKSKKKIGTTIIIVMIGLICMSIMPLTFANTVNESVIIDWDKDGIPDRWERANLLNPYCPRDAALDFNHNGRTNLQEFLNNSNPWNRDSDNDKISNYAETTGLFGFYTDPFKRDTDGDGLSDLIEITRHIDVMNATHMMHLFPDVIDRQKARIEIHNLRNRHLYTLDPTKWDTDGDGLSDGYELQRGLNPIHKDTDRDGLTDGREVLELRTNPLLRDTDGDGLIDSIELIGINGIIFNPLKWDTDGDGISDGEEAFGFGSAPIRPARYAMTYKEFLDGRHAGEYVTLMARVSRLVKNDTLERYYIYLNSLDEKDKVLGRSARVEVRNVGKYELFGGERIFVDNRFGFSLKMGDVIVVTGKAENISRGRQRHITVGNSGSIYLLLRLEEAQNRWLPSRKYVRIMYVKPAPPKIESLTQEERFFETLLREQDERIRRLERQLQDYRAQLDELKIKDKEIAIKEPEKNIMDIRIFGIDIIYMAIGVGVILILSIATLIFKMKFGKKKKSRDESTGIDAGISNQILNQSKKEPDFNQSEMHTTVEKTANKTIYK